MKLVILYRPRSEKARSVEEYVREFYRRTGHKIELLDVDSKQGSQTAQLYDIMQQPAVVALAEDGKLVQCWLGESMPLMDDVTGYLTR